VRDPFPRVLNPLPPDPFTPESDLRSPDVVRLFDRIRRELEPREEFAEFCWFAREYPRCYRHHISCAKHRLRSIYRNYEGGHARLLQHVSAANEDSISSAFSDYTTSEIYWDFESFLAAISSALDLLARIVGTAYKQHTPVSFTKLCKRTDLDGPARSLRAALRTWASKMKAYRDCFTHYTPAETALSVSTHARRDGWHVWCYLPRNPEARDIIRFRSSQRTDVLRYSLTVWHHMETLDRAISRTLSAQYRRKQFPQRYANLFAVGRNDSQPSLSGET
jgi:hypothetical protein